MTKEQIEDSKILFKEARDKVKEVTIISQVYATPKKEVARILINEPMDPETRKEIEKMMDKNDEQDSHAKKKQFVRENMTSNVSDFLNERTTATDYEKLSKIFGATSMRNYFKGIRCPDLLNIVVLADYFNVSVDEVIGRTI